MTCEAAAIGYKECPKTPHMPLGGRNLCPAHWALEMKKRAEKIKEEGFGE